jgi:DNA-binding NarL/FixJ family response regulator
MAVREAPRADGTAFLDVTVPVQDLDTAMEVLCRWGQVLRLPQPTGAPDTLPHLTRREREILTLLTTGAKVAAMGRKLGISEHTARGYLRGLRAKFGVHNSIALIYEAHRRGFRWY